MTWPGGEPADIIARFGRHWGWLLAYGILTLLAGVFVVAWPGPTLLVVDEPGAGLDEAQEAHVMAVLRRQADIGCVVIVAVRADTKPDQLGACDKVLVLTAAGALAFAGAPQEIESAFGTSDWSAVLARVSDDPDGANRAFRAKQPAPGAVRWRSSRPVVRACRARAIRCR